MPRRDEQARSGQRPPSSRRTSWQSWPNGQRTPQRSADSRSRLPSRSSRTCVLASGPRAGQARSASQIGRRACSWQRCRSSRATGRPTTTGASARRSSTRCRSSRPRSTGSRSTSSTCAPKHEDAMPLIMTHGWPGSVIELLETIGPLTDPTAHGGTPGDAFHLVLPSIPGYGFSGEPTELGWDADRIARAWAELMRRLGYTLYVAQGGDVGAYVTDAMGRQAPEGLLGIHLNVLTAAVALKDQLPAQSEQERAAHHALTTFLSDGFAIVLEQSTRPQTIGYALLDSPVGLAAWMLDHDTDSYYKISRAFVDGEPAGNLSRDNILDDMTLYWLTGTGASAARWYWEFGRAQAAAGAAGQAPPPVAVPVGFTNFPGEVFPAPRSWVEVVFPGLAYFNEPDRGGHFAAWEEPELFSTEVRAAFRSLR